MDTIRMMWEARLLGYACYVHLSKKVVKAFKVSILLDSNLIFFCFCFLLSFISLPPESFILSLSLKVSFVVAIRANYVTFSSIDWIFLVFVFFFPLSLSLLFCIFVFPLIQLDQRYCTWPILVWAWLPVKQRKKKKNSSKGLTKKNEILQANKKKNNHIGFDLTTFGWVGWACFWLTVIKKFSFGYDLSRAVGYYANIWFKWFQIIFNF